MVHYLLHTLDLPFVLACNDASQLNTTSAHALSVSNYSLYVDSSPATSWMAAAFEAWPCLGAVVTTAAKSSPRAHLRQLARCLARYRNHCPQDGPQRQHAFVCDDHILVQLRARANHAFDARGGYFLGKLNMPPK